MKNILLITVVILGIATSCAPNIDEIGGVYKPVTIASFTNYLKMEGHTIHLTNDFKVYLTSSRTVYEIGRYYKDPNRDSFIWNYNNNEITFTFVSEKEQFYIKFYKDNNPIAIYKRIKTNEIPIGHDEKIIVEPITDDAPKENWLN